jgi:protein CpxP
MKSLNLFLTLVLFSASVLSQYKNISDKTPEQIAERRSDKLRKILNLDDYQYKQVYEILYNSVSAVKNLREKMKNSDTDNKVLRSEIRKIRTETYEKIKPVLKPEQLNKFEELREKKMEKAKERRNKRHRKF